MNSTKLILPAALGMLLLTGNLPSALADSVEIHDAPLPATTVHGDYRNIRYYERNNGVDAPASADNGVVYEQVSFLTGSGFFTDSFNIEDAGTYQVTLTDFEFPQPFTTSGLNVTSATASFGSLMAPGSFSFAADPGQYFVSFFAEAPQLSQYGIEIAQSGIVIEQPSNVSAVPVPATAWLLGSGLIGLVGAIRRKSA